MNTRKFNRANKTKNHLSGTDSSDGSDADEIYCIFLHVVEGIGFNIKENSRGDKSNRKIISNDDNSHDNKIILNATLNGVQFEVDGHSTETTTIFNSNCIWECVLDDIKRLKTDNRPVKLELFLKKRHVESATQVPIGTLLLPIRGLPAVSNQKKMQLKLHWHKLTTSGTEWRHTKPELHLLLVIVKKIFIENGQFDSFLGKNRHVNDNNQWFSPNTNETAMMLQSQHNVYVQLLDNLGLIQVGNNPEDDCDIFNVTLTFKQLKNVQKLLELDPHRVYDSDKIVYFHFDFLGSASQTNISIDERDLYCINEKINLNFKTSLKSLRIYFQRIFYLPINLCVNDVAIANLRVDFAKLIPDDSYFDVNRSWTKCGDLPFDRLHRAFSANSLLPCVDYVFVMEMTPNESKRLQKEMMNIKRPTSVNHEFDNESFKSLQRFSLYMAEHCTSLSSSDEQMPRSSVKRKAFNEKFFKNNTSTLHQMPAHFIEKSKSNILMSNEPLQSTLKASFSDICIGTDRKTYKNIAVNTESLKDDEKANTDKTDAITLNIVQELEEWKTQQMQTFMEQLERKEVEYLNDLKNDWEEQRLILKSTLETKIRECEQLSLNLERSRAELMSTKPQKEESSAIADIVRREIEDTYTEKFNSLEQQMMLLREKLEDKCNYIKLQEREKQLQSKKLEHENDKMRSQIAHLEKQLKSVEVTYMPAQQIKSVIDDVRKQNENITEIKKSKKYYKEQFAKALNEVHKLKVHLIQHSEQCQKLELDNTTFNISLEEILNDEQDELDSDRNKLKSIKDILFVSSDNSSVCDNDTDYL